MVELSMPSVHQRQLISNKNLYLDGCSHKLGGRVLERDSLSLCPPFSVKDLSIPCGHDSPSVVAHHFAPCAIAAAQCWNVLCKITNIGASWINEQYTTTGGKRSQVSSLRSPYLPHSLPKPSNWKGPEAGGLQKLHHRMSWEARRHAALHAEEDADEDGSSEAARDSFSRPRIVEHG